MSCVMLALDGSIYAEQAMPHALGRLQGPADELLLVRVVEPVPPSHDAHLLGRLTRAAQREAEVYLHRLARLLRERGHRVRTLCAGGWASEELAACAAREHADLLVLASHGRTGPRRLLLGSVAESTVRRAACPVWVIRCTAPEFDLSEPWRVPSPTVRKILVPLDGTSLDALALDYLHRIGPREVTLLSAIDLKPAHEAAVAERLEAYLERVGRELWNEGWRVRIKVDDGFSAEAVLEEAASMRPDLIVMATRARRGLQRMTRGSVAERVLRRADCPVLLLPAALQTAPADAPSKSRSAWPLRWVGGETRAR